VVGVLLIVGIAGALSANNRAPSPLLTQNISESPRLAPDFKLTLFSGQTIGLNDFKGKGPVVINFWASWCDPCREEGPTLAKVSRMYEGKVKFIGIVYNDTQANAQAFMNEFGIGYDNGIDQGNIAADYRITGIPETFWIDKYGLIVGHWIGAIDEATLTYNTQKLIQ
jgi:cytochrome c biogenesis protein CcmG/thiol:disulfide interchange protein DsbE